MKLTSQWTYGPIDNILLLGGGHILRRIALWAQSEAMPLKVITSPRHACEVLTDQTLNDFLKQHMIEHIVIEDITDSSVKKFLGNTERSFCLSLGAAWVFDANSIASLFHNKLLNLHGTRLPQNRGGGAFSWQIMMGNKFGFCLLHLIERGLDAGAIVAFEEYLYPPTCRKPIDYDRVYTEKNLAFVIDFITTYRFASLPVDMIVQPEYLSTYWPRLSTDMNGWIDWSWEAPEIERFICAFDEPYAGARSCLNGKNVRLKSVCLSPQDGSFHSYQNGLVYRKAGKWFCVAVKGSTLVVEEIYDDNGVNVFDEVEVGGRFVTPPDLLVKAKDRPVFTPKGLKGA